MTKIENRDEHSTAARRAFLKKAGKAAVAAPAIAMLVSADVTPAAAVTPYTSQTQNS